jgi:hypothetical protein
VSSDIAAAKPSRAAAQSESRRAPCAEFFAITRPATRDRTPTPTAATSPTTVRRCG